ncbi:hypothetical protein [Oceanospirillum sp.]|uniref:hypothetical protein n=1 Tax=Oceanospirillum sp. TaxID=2021254 RepID=UPI003A93709A
MVLQRLGTLVSRAIQLMAFSLVLSGTALANDRALLQATIDMDRQYIPALIYIEQGDRESARDAMMKFSEQWSAFVTTFAVNSDDPEWPHFLDIASGMVSEAFMDVQDGELEDARKQLSAVTVTLHGLRERNGINYYIDELNAYKPYMDALIATADNKKGRLFTRAQIRVLQKNWAQVWPRWASIRHHVSRADFDQQLFGFTDDRFVELKRAVAQEQTALNRLRQALRTGTHREMADAAIDLEAGFMRTYRAFGDMPFE